MAAVYTFTKVGSTQPWTGTLTRAGAAKPITGATLTLYMQHEQLGTQEIDGDAVTIVSAADGTWSFTPTSADVDTAGVYRGEIKVVYTDGTVDYFPNRNEDRWLIVIEAAQETVE